MAGNVFFHDVPSLKPFSAGTTDVIVGSVNGNLLQNNDFVRRGEFPGAPDGCAVDFETNATGTIVEGNYFDHSYGAGVMVFGHADRSNRGLILHANTFVEAGCLQPRGDHGAVAFVHRASKGELNANTYVACANASIPVYNDVQPNASAEWVRVNESILAATSSWASWAASAPQLQVQRPSTPQGCFSVSLQPSSSSPSSSVGGVPGNVHFTVGGGAPSISDAVLEPGSTLAVCRTAAFSAKRFWDDDGGHRRAGAGGTTTVVIDIDGGE